jgi:glutaredoxin 2
MHFEIILCYDKSVFCFQVELIIVLKMIGTNVSLLLNDWKNKIIKLILGYFDCERVVILHLNLIL